MRLGRADEEAVEALVAEFVERNERGERLDPLEWARRHPGLREPLERALAALRATEDLFPAAPGDLPRARRSLPRCWASSGAAGWGACCASSTRARRASRWR